MNETIYEDRTITVTPTEIRAKGFVLYIEKISSISVTTIRPGKWPALFLSLPILMLIVGLIFMNRMLSPLPWARSPASKRLGDYENNCSRFQSFHTVLWQWQEI